MGEQLFLGHVFDGVDFPLVVGHGKVEGRGGFVQKYRRLVVGPRCLVLGCKGAQVDLLLVLPYLAYREKKEREREKEREERERRKRERREKERRRERERK